MGCHDQQEVVIGSLLLALQYFSSSLTSIYLAPHYVGEIGEEILEFTLENFVVYIRKVLYNYLRSSLNNIEKE